MKIGLSPNTSSLQGLCTYGIAARAASHAWLGMGVQGIGVRGVGDRFRGETPLFVVSVSNEIG